MPAPCPTPGQFLAQQRCPSAARVLAVGAGLALMEVAVGAGGLQVL